MAIKHRLMPDGRERVIRLLLLIIFAQFVVIAVLLGGLSSTYLSDAYFQAWVSHNAPIVAPLLHGELDALLVGASIGGTVLLIQQVLRNSKNKPDPSPGPKTSSPSYKPAPAIPIQTSQDDTLPDHAPPARSKTTPKQDSPEDIHKELEKTEY